MKTLSARIRWHKNAQRFLNHGLNHEAEYADAEISNDAWLMDEVGGYSHKAYQRGRKSGKALYAQQLLLSKHVIEDQCRRYTELSKLVRKRALRSDANHFCELLITFSREVNPDEEGSALDHCALTTAALFVKKHDLKILIVDKHNDEAKIHYHILLTAMSDVTHKPITGTIHKKELQQLQDMAAEGFASLGIRRGMKKAEKVKKTISENPKHDHETDKQYMQRIHKLANIRNKSVAELHATLEADLAAMELDAFERKRELEQASQIKVADQKALYQLQAEIRSYQSLLSEQQVVHSHLAKAAQGNQAKLDRSRHVIDQQVAGYETLKQQEREMKQSEIERLQAEIDASDSYLNQAVADFSDEVESGASYLTKPQESLKKDELEQVKQFEEVAAGCSDAPLQVMRDLSQPRNISSWARLDAARIVFREGIRRICSKVSSLIAMLKGDRPGQSDHVL